MQPQKSLFGLIITILLSIAAEKLVVKIPTPPKFPPFPPLLGKQSYSMAQCQNSINFY